MSKLKNFGRKIFWGISVMPLIALIALHDDGEFWRFLHKNPNQLTALTSVINILLVFSIFIYNSKNKKEEIKLTRTAFWFGTIILKDDNIKLVQDFFQDSIGISKLSCDENEWSLDAFKKEINKFQVRKREVIDKFNSMLKIIDLELSNRLDEILDEYEDGLTREFGKILNVVHKDEEITSNKIDRHYQECRELTDNTKERFFLLSIILS
ncbi:MAG: hypothetical protein ACLKAO_13040 [Alkaliphilus sp.]